MMRNKILIIEDDILVRENLKQLLEEEGFETEVAENGEVGIKKAQMFNPDLIICDILMPVVDGYKVKEVLNNHDETFDIPFVFLTAKTRIEDLRKGMGLGADDYIFKPYNSLELLRIIEKKLNKQERLIEKIRRKNNNSFQEEQTLFVGFHQKEKIDIKSIDYIKAENQYTFIHLISGKYYYFRKSLSYWEKKLPETLFKRIHRSYIINVRTIEKIEKGKNGLLKVNIKNISKDFFVSRKFAKNIKRFIL